MSYEEAMPAAEVPLNMIAKLDPSSRIDRLGFRSGQQFLENFKIFPARFPGGTFKFKVLPEGF